MKRRDSHQPNESQLRAAAAGLPDLGGTGTVGLEFGNFAEGLGEAFQQLPVEGRLGLSEGVVAPQAGLADQNQIGLPQVGQVSRDPRLGGEQDCYDVPDAEFAALQNMENPQARPVGKSPEHQVDAVQCLGRSGLRHIGLRGWCLRDAHPGATPPRM